MEWDHAEVALPMGYIVTDANLLATVIFDWIDPAFEAGGSWSPMLL